MDKDTSVNDGFKNLKLFISESALYAETDDENAWFIDSSASPHMTCNKEWYDDYYEKIDGTHIYLGDNRSHKVQGYGVISVNLPNEQLTITDNKIIVEFVKLRCVVKDIQNH